MRASIIFLIAFFIGTAYSFDGSEILLDRINNEAYLKSLWNSFKYKNGLNYESTSDSLKFDRFKENLALVAEHNREYDRGNPNITYKVSLNLFADMNRQEFVKSNLGLKSFIRQNQSTVNDLNANLDIIFRNNNSPLPSQVNWVEKQAVTPVKHQLNCGSCWAFAAIAVVESLHLIKTKKTRLFSEQNLVDCTYNTLNFGCDGGWPSNALKYAQSNGVVDSYIAPYKAKEERCLAKSRVSSNNIFKIRGHADIPDGDDEALKRVLALNGPVAIAIDASNWSFQFYSDGIYNDQKCNGQNLNHAVTLVGYGTENGQDYWLIKNSWGRSWGKNGYMKMSRRRRNYCGISSMATYAYL